MANKARGGRIITLLGLLAGAAVGAAVALVYTPHNGERNRENLSLWTRNRADDLNRKVNNTVQEVKQQANLKVQDVRQQANLKVQDVKNKVTG